MSATKEINHEKIEKDLRKQTLEQFSEELIEHVLEGTSTSNVMQLIRTYHEPKNFEEAVEPLMKFLSENHHPHTMVEVESNKAVLWEGLQTHLTDKFIID